MRPYTNEHGRRDYFYFDPEADDRGRCAVYAIVAFALGVLAGVCAMVWR